MATEMCATCDLPIKATVAEGEWLTVRKEYIFRASQQGEVIGCHDDGCSLDFYKERPGCPGVTQEFWEWGELEICECGEHQPYEDTESA